VSDAAEPSADIQIIGGSPTPAEIAAVTAVLQATLAQLADEATRKEIGPTAWQRSQRPMRTPVHPGAGVWRGFSA
jgi:hypothetical protein